MAAQKASESRILSVSRRSDSALRSAVGQLTLIEHCLCPLDARKSLSENFVHETSYAFSKDGKRQQASVRVSCPGGLTAEDEFYSVGSVVTDAVAAQADGEPSGHPALLSSPTGQDRLPASRRAAIPTARRIAGTTLVGNLPK